MKKTKDIIATICGTLLIAGAIVFAIVKDGNNQKLSDFAKANIDALASSEYNFGASIWWVHRYDGGMNCTKGGSEKCL